VRGYGCKSTYFGEGKSQELKPRAWRGETRAKRVGEAGVRLERVRVSGA